MPPFIDFGRAIRLKEKLKTWSVGETRECKTLPVSYAPHRKSQLFQSALLRQLGLELPVSLDIRSMLGIE